MAFDTSTAQRVLEASIVANEFDNSNIFNKFFGKGLGATINLSNTLDTSIKNSHDDLEAVRIIHLGFFFILHKFGIIGILLYYSFFITVVLKSIKITYCLAKIEGSNNTDNSWISLMAYYCIAIIFDGQITSGHLFANHFFWFCFINILFFENSYLNRGGNNGKNTRLI